MRKTTLLTVLALAALSAPALAAEDAPKSKLSVLKTWFSHLKQGLSESAVSGHYQKANVTAVAAVRGAGQETVDPSKPQWKSGKSKRAERAKAERAEFAAAVDLIIEGKTKEGLEGFDAFEKAHPKSSLLEQVREAREKVKELESAVPGPDLPAAAPEAEKPAKTE